MADDFNSQLRRAARRRRGVAFEAPVFEDQGGNANEAFNRDLRRRVRRPEFTVTEREGTPAEQRASDYMGAAIRRQLPPEPDPDDGLVVAPPDFGGGLRGPASAEDPETVFGAAFNEALRAAAWGKRDGQYRPAVRRKQ